MWIRSQCKTTLIEVKNISTDDGVILHYNGDETYTILGEYSTEEKAIKVLDMIQDRICGIEYTHLASLIKSGSKFVTIDASGTVFQMPQDSEVE